jgi:cell division protease FtsH
MPELRNQRQFTMWYLLAAVVGLLLLQTWFVDERAEHLAYSEFKALLHADALEDLTIGEAEIRGTVLTARVPGHVAEEAAARLASGDAERRAFRTQRMEDPRLVEELDAAGIRYAASREARWIGPVLWLVVWVGVFVLIWLVLLRRMGSGASGMMSVGKSKAKVYVESDTKVTFDDVAGVDEAKQELQEIVNFLRDPARYGRLGAHVPKGVLLVGPPGTGKTLFARAVAGEARVPFFSISGSEFVEMFVGVGAARVRDLFEQARQRAPAIIFIDELDALGRARGVGAPGGGHDEKEQTLNQLLVEMDGFDPSQGLVLLAATNRPEILDPALLRAGRFDRQVLVDRPDKFGRVAILKVHVRKVKLAADVELEAVAALTPGFTGADLANLVNEAALLATRREGDAVALDDFTNAIERIIAGLEKKNRLLNPHEREVVAFHEMGHALVAMAVPGVDPVHKISIIPRGIGALGYTIQRPTEDRFLMTMRELENKMTVLMGGRAAEHLVFGHYSTGAADDLAKATDIARGMVMRYGMDPQLGHVVYDEQRRTFLEGPAHGVRTEVSDATAEIIDRSVRALLQRAFDRAIAVLEANRGVLENGARTLLTQEVMGEHELKALAGDVRPAVEPTLIETRAETQDRPVTVDGTSRPSPISR